MRIHSEADIEPNLSFSNCGQYIITSSSTGPIIIQIPATVLDSLPVMEPRKLSVKPSCTSLSAAERPLIGDFDLDFGFASSTLVRSFNTQINHNDCSSKGVSITQASGELDVHL